MIRSFRVWATVAMLAIALTGGACEKKPRDVETAEAGSGPGAAADQAANSRRRPSRHRRPSRRAHRPRTRSSRAMSLDELNKKGVLSDVFFALDSTDLNAGSARPRLRRTSST